MKRDAVQTVAMPILVAASPKRASGRAPLDLAESGFIREVTDADAHRWSKTAFTATGDFALFVGITKLRWAWGKRDDLAALRAYELLAPYVQSNIPPKPKTVPVVAGVSLEWSGWNFGTAPEAYTSLLTDTLRNARFVVWYAEREKRMLPGLYCPDRRIAVLAMGMVERLRVCPKCDAPFVPGAGNVAYCSVKHREAHRIDRFRYAKKLAEEGARAGPRP